MNFMSLFRIKDPIYPEFKIDEYKSNFALMQSYAVNRLRFIKQLGLKAYSGRFPSANHTRYEHSIGAMHLSRQFCEQLYKNTQDLDLRGSIKEYGPTIEIAALLHDIGHGPFSHVIDDILGIFGESHEKMTVKIIEGLLANDIKNLNPSIDIKDVCSIILGNHSKHAYLNDVIHGHFDVDRMDYLARDAYFTATEYQWRAYSLMQSMKVSKIPRIADQKVDALKKEIESSRIPKRKEIKDAMDLVKDLWTDHVCICDEEGIVHAEMMLVTRRTMYKNVYYETSSRIAEKMISRAIL
jgi:HD superfamily phosphohydrolase